MDFIDVKVDSEGVALLAFDRPEVLNVLNTAMMQELLTALEHLATDANVKALVLTGRGRGFCAGADLSAVADGASGNHSVGEKVAAVMESHFNPLMDRLYQFPKPTLCAVNGIAAGGSGSVCGHCRRFA